MSYGGLRGAVGFSLAKILSDDNLFKDMFVTTTIVMVLFTVFIQGGTIKLLVEKLEIKRNDMEVSENMLATYIFFFIDSVHLVKVGNINGISHLAITLT